MICLLAACDGGKDSALSPPKDPELNAAMAVAVASVNTTLVHHGREPIRRWSVEYGELDSRFSARAFGNKVVVSRSAVLPAPLFEVLRHEAVHVAQHENGEPVNHDPLALGIDWEGEGYFWTRIARCGSCSE